MSPEQGERPWSLGLSDEALVSLCQQSFSPEALTATTGGKPLTEESLFNGRYELLRFLASNDSGLKWQAVIAMDREIDRDACIQTLWELVRNDPRLEAQRHSAEYHRWYFFRWFLERYDLARARTVWTKESLGRGLAGSIRYCQYILLLAVVGLAALLTPAAFGWFVVGSMVASLIVCGVVLQWLGFRQAGSRMAPFIAAYSLIPRLAGTVLVGFLFLLSNQQLSRFVLGRRSYWKLVLTVVALSTLYVVLEMSRRVHPVPKLPTLFGRAVAVVSTGAAYALALALTGMPAIRFVAAEASPKLFTFGQTCAVAAIILTIGLVLNVIWSEDPVTKPL